MRLHLEHLNWTEEFINKIDGKGTAEMWDDIKNMIMNVRNLFVPKQLESKKPVWKEKGSFPINKKLQEAIENKQKLHKR